ncbi:hypothetical protein BCR44DRAFT_31130 [Catenaria anguillulae PL171]|uniref:Uncharacterized protein n=1 Tax=Catenaria anguillulae PL171 TaxID=765915 RepID=A0A1Y2HVH7_9FUNG|nr:hypothetical protein BCR44DRAFT_31130 [Catenaria anguillulae PL171]
MDSFAPSTHGHGLAAPAISPPSAASPVSPGPAAQRAANRKVEQLLRRTLSNSSASRANSSNIAYRPLHPVPVALPTLTRLNVAAGYRHVVAGSNRASSPLSPAALITSPDSITSPLASPRSPHHGQPPTASPSARYSAVVANSPISPKAVGQLRRPSIAYAGSPQRTVISEPSPAVSLIGSIAAASTLEMGEREVGVARARSGPSLLKRISHGISDGTARRVRGYAIRWWWKQRYALELFVFAATNPESMTNVPTLA